MNEDKQSRLERFKDAARQLGCNEDEAAFDEKLKAIARQKPKSVLQRTVTDHKDTASTD